eukprot:PITA_05630
MQDKVKKWTYRSLNLAGRLVLTKAVLQAIPIFMLSVLPVPKGVLQQFSTIQRDFLWGKEETRKKLALVSWEKICKPKNQGGLGLDDLEILNNALGAKLWWRWVKDPRAQWESIWKEKYASSWHYSKLIRMSGNLKGSPIWNKAWENREVVQKNSFWEIRDGDQALFWKDKWQQKPILLKEELLGLKQETDNQGMVKVKDFWDNAHNTGKWRIWKRIDGREDSTLNGQVETLRKMIDQRMILITEGKIITWDNIRKRGILGPSRCQLCGEQEETMEHLLNSCIFTSKLWDFFANIFNQSNRDKESITNTLHGWRNYGSNNEILYSAWALLPSFILWNVWKERNKRIFKEEKNTFPRLLEQILK